MHVIGMYFRRSIEAALLAVLLLLGTAASADVAEQLQKGEEVIVLDVENMT